MIDINEMMRRPIYEPKKRWCGGVYGWVAHRFPVKGGISMREVWTHVVANSLYEDIMRGRRLTAALERRA